MWSTPSLSSLSGQLWHGMAETVGFNPLVRITIWNHKAEQIICIWWEYFINDTGRFMWLGYVVLQRRSMPLDTGNRKPASMSRAPRLALLEPPEAVPQALNISGEARFDTRNLFLEKRRRGPRHFWSRRACLGYGPPLGPTLKWPSAALPCL